MDGTAGYKGTISRVVAIEEIKFTPLSSYIVYSVHRVHCTLYTVKCTVYSEYGTAVHRTVETGDDFINGPIFTF